MCGATSCRVDARTDPGCSAPYAAGMPTRILVIEDNTATRDFVVRLLREAEHQACAAENGEKGLLLVRSERPDVVLCDIELPGMDGFEVLRRLKADPATRGMPVLAVTAFSMLGSRERALAAGFDGFIAKPVTSKMLAAGIEAAMGGRK